MRKIFIGLIVAILIVSTLFTIIRVATGFFTNNYDIIDGATAVILLVLLLGVEIVMILDIKSMKK